MGEEKNEITGDGIIGEDGVRVDSNGEIIQTVKKSKKYVLVKRVENVDRYVLYFSIEKMMADMNDRLTVFFIRSTDGDIPKGGDSSLLNSHFEFSALTG